MRNDGFEPFHFVAIEGLVYMFGAIAAAIIYWIFF